MTTSRPFPEAAPQSPPTVTTAVGRTGGGQCSQCAAHLAPDQRYCVECGRRTNEARPTLMREPGQQGVQDLSAATAAAPAALRPRSGTSQGQLIAGVGVLLLAMGVGVLIGHNNSKTPTTSGVPAGYVQAPLAAAAATTPGVVDAAATTPDTSAAAGATTDSAAAKKAAKAAKAAAAAAPAGGVVKPKAGKKVKVGDTGSGPGFDKKTHKFTGDFFGN